MTEVMLREVTTSDLPIFFEHQRDPVACEMAGFPSRDWETFLAHWTKILDDALITKMTILVDGQPAGNVVSFLQDGDREVGYWIGREYWGKGIATKALSAFLHHESTRPLYAHVEKHNGASMRVLEKCGFVYSGERRVTSREAGGEDDDVMLILGAGTNQEYASIPTSSRQSFQFARHSGTIQDAGADSDHAGGIN
jgi:RimJ/RimL family protein N-acetyltransferase